MILRAATSMAIIAITAVTLGLIFALDSKLAILYAAVGNIWVNTLLTSYRLDRHATCIQTLCVQWIKLLSGKLVPENSLWKDKVN